MSIKDFCNDIKRSNIQVIRVPERDWGRKTIWKSSVWKPPRFRKRHSYRFQKLDEHQQLNSKKTMPRKRNMKLKPLKTKDEEKKNFFFLSFLPFLGPLPRPMEVPRLGVQSEPPAFTTATAMPYPSCICNLHHSSRQRQMLNPLSKAGDRTRNLWLLVRFINHWATMRTPRKNFWK